jgi:hypothetical protein
MLQALSLTLVVFATPIASSGEMQMGALMWDKAEFTDS